MPPAEQPTVADIGQRLQVLRRQLGTVQLLAVCKGQPLARIQAAARAGQRDFAENYLQEAEAKIAALPLSTEPIWHFIGALQRNKAARVGEIFDWVQTLHRPELIPLLVKRRAAERGDLQICIQIRGARQGAHRNGIAPAHAEALARQVAEQPGLVLRGLMCMASSDADTARAEFAATRACFENLRRKYTDMDTLCMGTSGDRALAVAEGSTMVRIGQDLFGERTAKRE